jgi:hypothetical protein
MPIQVSDMMPGVMNCITNVAKVKSGEEVLIIADTTTDIDVVEAYKIGATVAGATVSVLTLKSPGAGASSAELTERLLCGFWPKMAFHAMAGADLCINLTGFADMHGLFGTGCSYYGIGPLDIWEKYKTKMLSVTISSKEGLASDWATYPEALLRYLGYKAHQQVLDAAGANMDDCIVRVTDPQGTDISFKGFRMCTKGQSGSEQEKLFYFYTFGTQVVGMKPQEPEPNAEGVIVSTSIHTGYIPEMKVTVQGGRAVKVEGGGQAGIMWARDWEKGKGAVSDGRQTSFGNPPGPGINWMEELMYGVHPKAFRVGYRYRYEGSHAFQAWVGGTRRSGVVHFGFGGGKDEWYRHRDLELFFPTLTVNGETIIENGHLKILDDHEVREETAKYGDPDELLTEKWIPELPPLD